jgi:CDP-glucose 4,6-dehydratase
MGTVHVLEAARRTAATHAVVVVTSDKCYENRDWPWPYREGDPLGGHDPYSSSKGCAELVTASYRASFWGRPGGVAVASARAGNVIGGGDWAEDRVMPDLVRAFGAGDPAIIRHPGAVRPWQHVLEPLRGYLMLGERLARDGHAWAEAWNFGPRDDDVLTVGALADAIVATWGRGARWVKGGADGPAEARLLRVDSSKARERLGWRPLLGVTQAVGWAVEWYRAYHDNPASARKTTDSQIDAYMNLPGG